MIPYGRQDISDEDVRAVVEVLRSEFLTQGPVVPAFEDAVARRCRVAHAVATNSGTSALHLACLALGVGPGDHVWTSPITFVASANCARYCGANVDFVDIDPRTGNMSAERLDEKAARAAREGRLPKVVIPVHFGGQPCDMAAIHALGERYGFRIVEDASHALGATYRGEPVGCGRHSDITVFSFHPVKIITTGEGGMAVTQDRRLAGRMRRLRSHGITREPDELTQPTDGPWYYEQPELGFNYRMTDLEAALGLSQLGRLDGFTARRRALALRYDRLLERLPADPLWQAPFGESAWHLYVVRLRAIGVGRADVFARLRSAGVRLAVHYIPVYRQPYYRALGFLADDCPEAERYYGEAVSLPLFVKLTEAEQDHVVAALADVLRVGLGDRR